MRSWMTCNGAALGLWLLVVALVPWAGAAGCAPEDEGSSWTSARVVERRDQLIGGPRALGEVGDILLENDQIRAVIQAPGFSRGFGVYGGSIIDLDLRRARDAGSSGGGPGVDALGEIFPAFFLQAVAVDTVEVIHDGRDGQAAVVRASGHGGDFLTLVDRPNRLITGAYDDRLNSVTSPNTLNPDPILRFEIDYRLEPGAQWIETTFRVINLTEQRRNLPASPVVGGLLNSAGIPCVPVGDVALFGALSSLFAPGVGFDVRFGLQRAYAQEYSRTVFAGLLTDWLATRSSTGVSYGYISAGSERNIVYRRAEIYGESGVPITPRSLLIPFTASGFVGMFYDCAPSRLLPFGSEPDPETGESDRFEATKYVVVGSGDVGSVLDQMHVLMGVPVGEVTGQVFDEVSSQPALDVRVFFYQRDESGERRIYSQVDAGANGQFRTTLEPGAWSARVVGDGRLHGEFVDFEVVADARTPLTLVAPSPGRVVVNVFDSTGQRLPAKVTAVGTYGPEFVGVNTQNFLFDLLVGESFRYTDMIPDDPDDPETRRYIEATVPTYRGVGAMRVRPGTYDIVSSRGIDYETDVTQQVTVRPGDTVTVNHVLRRAVELPGWIGADLHLHSMNSIDSSEPLDRRVLSLAAEGLHWGVATDHNFVSDFSPYIARTGLQDWLRSSVGIELTTLEAGHFNAFPLERDRSDIGGGIFGWSERKPDELFAQLRSRAAHGPENMILQVNHPRDSILGYFNQFRRSGVTFDYYEPSNALATPSGPAFYHYEEDGTVEFTAETSAFSFDFDAIELINGKRLDQLRHYRMPDLPEEAIATLPAGVRNRLPEVGGVLLERPNDPEPRVGFAGVVDDWFNLLNLGYRYIGVGNSDSHGPDTEAGFPRTLVYTGTSDVREVSELAFVQALQSRRVQTTNGPVVDFRIGEVPIGGDAVANGPTIEAELMVTAASWVSVGRVNIIRNGLVYQVLTLDEDRNLSDSPFRETLVLELETCDGPGVPLESCTAAGEPIDTWFLVETIGYRSLFPVVRPNEIPTVDIADAVGALGSVLGLDGGEFGPLGPADVAPATPYGITNPIWVRTEAGRAFQARGVQPIEAQVAPTNNPGLNQNPFNEPFQSWLEAALDPEVRPMILAQTAGDGHEECAHETSVTWERRGLFVLPRIHGETRFELPHHRNHFGHAHGHHFPYTFLERDPANPYDIRRIIEAFDHGHAH